MSRQENLMPNDVPRWIRVYDDGGGEYVDRYTVVFTNLKTGWYQLLSMDEDGRGSHSEYPVYQLLENKKLGQWPPSIGRRGNLGKRIAFFDLPESCQLFAIQDYKELWSLK